MIDTPDITGVVLAGGRGSRMGGVDKGLQLFRGRALAHHALLRLQPQVGAAVLNANRHLPAYAAFGVPVWPDGLSDFPGPLGGFLTGLQHCATGWLLTVPCDTPLFPHDLTARLARAADAAQADIAIAAAPETDDAAGTTVLRRQPVFCLMRTTVQGSLHDYLQSGGRKIGTWLAQHTCAVAAFDQPGDAPHAFANANTLAELHSLEQGAHP
ncbi:MAG: molybdenum cofactor guanylyltransferase MobA [Comamonadaceae bacterium]|nr:MAG: molybdenum cofactor guanylyltransferase MobA [Comamonadaceae bacterium]